MFSALILGLLGFLGAVVTTAVGAGVGAKNTQDTNQTNLDISRETNAANVEQANLSYLRSLPSNQVRNLMDAGMSKGAALQSLTGGGSYTAPVLNGATQQPFLPDLSGMSSAFERLGNIPMNVEQEKMIRTQRLALQKDIEIKEHAEQRSREQHDFDMWEKQYGQKGALALDTASKLLFGKLQDSGREIDSFSSYNDMIRELGLSQEPIIRDLPYSARVQLQDSVRSLFEESRAQQTQDNQNRAADDAHRLSEQQLSDLKYAAEEYAANRSTRDSENAAKRIRSIVDQYIATYDLSMSYQQAARIFKLDNDGNVIFKDGKPEYQDKDNLFRHNASDIAKQYDTIRSFWNGLFELLPVNLSSTILRAILK